MAESKYYGRTRPEMTAFVPEAVKTVLDIGCAEGNFAALLMNRGKKVWGIEPSPSCVEACRGKLSGFFSGTFSDYIDQRKLASPRNASDDILTRTFDCIVFNDILEHLIDPWDALRQSAAMLSSGGCVVASIPNVRHYKVLKQLLFKKDWRYVDSGVLDRTHLRFFTQKSIVRLFTTSDYRVDIIQGINKSSTPIVSLINILLFNLLGGSLFYQFAVRAYPLSRPVG